MNTLYSLSAWLRAKQAFLVLFCVFLGNNMADAQNLQLYLNGAVTTDNQSVESLTPIYCFLAAVPYGTTPPSGTYQWLKNEQPTSSSYWYISPMESGVYRLRFTPTVGAVQVSNCVVFNFGKGPDNRNYSTVDHALYNGIKETPDLNQSDGFNKQITYQDGFGRPMQQIAVNSAAGTNKDFVQAFSYGAQGEQTKSYLPFALGNNGQYKENWQGDQNAFYQWVSPKVGRPGNGPAYSEIVADNDPLGRVSEKASPGESWKLGTQHTQQIFQRSNTTSDNVRLWTYAPGAGFGITGTLSWTTAGADKNTLSAVETKDEDDKWTVVFTNEKGQTVCQRTYLSGSASNPPANPSDFLETNYAYDAGGHLLAVVPPKAVQLLLASASNNTNTVLEQYLFITQYDALGRSIARKVPGKGWTYTVYDRWDRVAATQDQNQLRQGIWSFIKYDALNRAIITGQYNSSLGPDALANALQTSSDKRAEQRANTEVGYTLNLTFPTDVQLYGVATVDYYDDYGYYPLSAGLRPDLAFVAEGNYAAASTQTRGMHTGGRNRTLSGASPDQWLTTVVYYDQYGRAVQTLRDNFTRNASGTACAVDRSTSQFQFTGEPFQTVLTHHRYDASGNLETHTTNIINYYDNGRLTLTQESIDGAPYVKVQALEYNELGQVVDKKLGYDRPNYSYIQSLDYRYNIRGWLTNINNRNLSNNEWLDNNTPNSDTEPRDAFGLELKYEGGGTSPGCYSGNISAAIWNTTTGRMRQYGYEYDKANRLIKGKYSALDYVGGNYVWTAEKYDAQGEGLYTLDGISYDPNGNITALTRSGLVSRNANTGAKAFGRIDELTMDHDGNRLLTVRDGIVAPTAATNDFENGSTVGVAYEYDANGNLTRDPNKNLSIYYNQLNLPYFFYFTNGNMVSNTYTSTGEKVSATYYSLVAGSYSVKTVQYIQGFTYSTSPQEPLTVATPTGRAVFEGAATQTVPARWGHEYHIRDHQGSLRLVLRQDAVTSYRLTMELANAQEEEVQFKRVAETRQLDASHARTGISSARLNAHQPERANGPATVLTVAAGDSISLEVFGLYDKGRSAPQLGKAVMPVLAIGGSLATAPVIVPDYNTQVRRSWVPTVTAGVTVAWGNLRGLFGQPKTLPQASFRYELYNKDSVLVASSTELLAETGQAEWQQLLHGFRAKEAGYVKIYLANASGTDAWFDDLQVNRFPVPTTQENHYDPFGQNLPEIELASGFDSKQQYTGQEKIDNFGLNLNDYSSRYYDSQLGRFQGIDGAASSYRSQGPYNYCQDNPINHVDPDGRNPLLMAMFQGAVAGAFLDAGFQLAKGGKFDWGQFTGAVLAGAVTGGMAYGKEAFLSKNLEYFNNMSLLGRYAGLADYAATTALAASLVGQAASDLVNDGALTHTDNYLASATPAIATALGASALSSAYSYATWDRYSLEQRAEMMRQETGVYATYDYSETENDMTTISHLGEDGNTSINVVYKADGLYSRQVARINYGHEMQHISDIGSGVERPIWDYEGRAYTISQQMASRSFTPIRYQIGWENQLVGGMPKTITPFNILASLFR